jgi:hypothetical protein
MFVLIDVLKILFLSSCRLDSYISISSTVMISLWASNGDAFSFPCPKRKSVVLNSLKSCWCLQAQWWKAKSLLDRWNLPSGYVSSMESNCWASESFLSVNPLEILLSVRREKMMKTSKCWPKEVFRFFFSLSWDFSQKLFFFKRLWRDHDDEMWLQI